MNTNFSKIIVLFLFSGLISSLFGQNSASDWFQRGLNATSIDDKIIAFSRATELDPNYVEAYFYLGLAYKTKKMYPKAEVAFNKAYFKNPFALNNEIKTRILFEMGLVNILLGKITEARDALRGAAETAGSNSALKGRIHYELGLIYIEQGEYDLAIKELRDGSNLWPQNRDHFDQALAKADDKKSLNNKYNRGIAFLNQENYQRAINEFTDIIRIEPGFKDVQSQLTEAKNGLQKQVNSVSLNSQVTQPLTTPQTITKRKATPSVSQVEQFYQNGKISLQNKQWQQAVNAFEKVQQIDNNYKDTYDLLSAAQKNIKRVEKQMRQYENLYNAGLDYLNKSEWQKALENFKKLQDMNPGYKDIETHLSVIKQAILKQKNNTAKIDSLYQQGLFALQNGDWLHAVLAFEKVKLLDANFKNVQSKLADAKFNLDKSNGLVTEANEEGGSSILAIWGGALSLLVLPIVAAFIFSPSLKARMYLIQGKYDQAALIYEKIVDKKPEKVKLYPILANIYLLEDRKDEKAILVLERVLKLNMMLSKRDQINTIVANHYLKQGRTDNGAIAIMEKELTNKINKLQSGAV